MNAFDFDEAMKSEQFEKLEGMDRGLFVLGLYQGMFASLRLRENPSGEERELIDVIGAMVKGIDVFLRVSFDDYEKKLQELMSKQDKRAFEVLVNNALLSLRLSISAENLNMKNLN